MSKPILCGAGELYMQAFSGTAIPEHTAIETPANNVGECEGGFTVNYKPTKYDVENWYGQIVKSFITKEEISCKAGIMSWDLDRLKSLSTATVTSSSGKKTLTFTGKGAALPNILVRFVHTKDDGKKIRFTMIGQGGAGFALSFESKQLTIDSEFTAIKVLDGFLASFEEEIASE